MSDTTTSTPLLRVRPSDVGVPVAAVHAVLDGFDARDLEMHSLMVVRHGHVAAEGWWAPYSAERVHLLYSLSKSFTSTAVGFALAEGRFRLDDRVVDLLPRHAPDDVDPAVAQPDRPPSPVDVDGSSGGHPRPRLAAGPERPGRRVSPHPAGGAGRLPARVQQPDDDGARDDCRGAHRTAAPGLPPSAAARPIGIGGAVGHRRARRRPRVHRAPPADRVRRAVRAACCCRTAGGTGSASSRRAGSPWPPGSTSTTTTTPTAPSTGGRAWVPVLVGPTRVPRRRRPRPVLRRRPEADLVVATTARVDDMQQVLDVLWDRAAAGRGRWRRRPGMRRRLASPNASSSLTLPVVVPTHEGPDGTVRFVVEERLRTSRSAWARSLSVTATAPTIYSASPSTSGAGRPLRGTPLGGGSARRGVSRGFRRAAPSEPTPVVCRGGWTGRDTFEADLVLIETPHRIRLRGNGSPASRRRGTGHPCPVRHSGAPAALTSRGQNRWFASSCGGRPWAWAPDARHGPHPRCGVAASTAGLVSAPPRLRFRRIMYRS